MFDRLVSRWQGVLLSLIGIVATVWLAVTGQLGLYIHPRYYGFTVAMALIAGVAALAAFALPPVREPEAGVHEHGEDRRMPRTSAALGATVVVVAAVALLVLPPATLSSATVAQRDLNSAAVGDAPSPALMTGDYGDFTVRDWAALLRQNPDPAFFAGKPVSVTGFVTPDPSSPDDVFYVARFIVTCCAVDAQPVGVPVYLPGWRERYEVDSWVEVGGSLAANPDGASSERIALVPASITPVEMPAEPYVY